MDKQVYDSWADLCEHLLDRLESLGEDTTYECAAFGVLLTNCCVKGCGGDLKPKGGNND
jgi:hypothetical protein